MDPLDRTGQRIVGVLIEKELTVPDNYPLSENALVDGCNQRSNRDPAMDLEQFQVAGALMALQQGDWVARVEGGGRVAKFRHRARDELRVDNQELAVLAELLLRGPQAPGALKPRVQRMGYHAEAPAIETLLRAMAARRPALVEQLPIGPRERERRWRHLLGDGSEVHAHATSVSEADMPMGSATPRAAVSPSDLASRVSTLEGEVAELRREVAALRAARGGHGNDGG